MKKIIYKSILIIFVILVLLSHNIIYASMADYTDEQADNNLKQEQEEFKKEQEEKINKSSNNYLKKLSVKGYEITPNFDKQTINYELTQEVGNDNIEIEAESDDEKASITGNGKIALNSGENNIKIDVTAENGMVRSYFIKIKKSVKKDIRLKSLEIKTSEDEEVEITPEFNSNIFEYKCDVKNYIDKLNVKAVADGENQKIEITGNENLKEGLNEILVTVSTENDEKVVYKISAYKEKSIQKQEQNEENNKQIDYKTYIPIVIVIVIIIVVLFVKSRNKGKHDK